MATLTGLRRPQQALIRRARSSVQVCCNLSAGTSAVDFVEFGFVSFDGVESGSDLSETSALQDGFLLAGIASGRQRAVDVEVVERRLSGERASRERIKMLMLVVIGTVIPWQRPLLWMAVIRLLPYALTRPTGSAEFTREAGVTEDASAPFPEAPTRTRVWCRYPVCRRSPKTEAA